MEENEIIQNTEEQDVDFTEDESSAEDKIEEKPEEINEESGTNPELPKTLETIPVEKMKGRIVVFNPKDSEFAKNLELNKIGDYVPAKK